MGAGGVSGCEEYTGDELLMRLSIERTKLIEKAYKRLGKKCKSEQLTFRCNIEALNHRDQWINAKAEYIQRRCGDAFLLAWDETILIRAKIADTEYYSSLITGDIGDDEEWAFAMAHAIAVELWYKMRSRTGSLYDFELDEVSAWLDVQLSPAALRRAEFADLPLFALGAV